LNPGDSGGVWQSSSQAPVGSLSLAGWLGLCQCQSQSWQSGRGSPGRLREDSESGSDSETYPGGPSRWPWLVTGTVVWFRPGAARADSDRPGWSTVTQWRSARSPSGDSESNRGLSLSGDNNLLLG